MRQPVGFGAGGSIVLWWPTQPQVVLIPLGTLLRDSWRMDLIDTSHLTYYGCVDFPLFEYSKEEERYVAKHHPFTRPR